MPIEFLKVVSSVPRKVQAADDDLLVDDAEDELLDNSEELTSLEADGDWVDEDEDEDSDDDGGEEDLSDEEESTLKLYELLGSFYALNAEPTDEQFHALALSIGVTPEYLEEQQYKVMSVIMSDDPSAFKDALKDSVSTANAEDTGEWLPAEGELDGEPDMSTL
jgi:hypothetical protein